MVGRYGGPEHRPEVGAAAAVAAAVSAVVSAAAAAVAVAQLGRHPQLGFHRFELRDKAFSPCCCTFHRLAVYKTPPQDAS